MANRGFKNKKMASKAGKKGAEARKMNRGASSDMPRTTEEIREGETISGV